MSLRNYFESIIDEKYGKGARYIGANEVSLLDGTTVKLSRRLRPLGVELEREKAFGPDAYRTQAVYGLYVLEILNGSREDLSSFIKRYEGKSTRELFERFDDILDVRKVISTKLTSLCTKKLRKYPTTIEKSIEDVVRKADEEELLELLDGIETLKQRPDVSVRLRIESEFPTALYVVGREMVLK